MMYQVQEKKIDGQDSKWLVRDHDLTLAAECPTEDHARRITKALNASARIDYGLISQARQAARMHGGGTADLFDRLATALADIR